MKSWKLYLYRIIVRFLPETRCFSVKASLLRWCGAVVGHNVRINSSAHIIGVGNLEIGDDVWIGNDVILMPDAPASLRIGNCVDIGPACYIGTGSHQIDVNGAHSAGRGKNADISIEDGVWIGARSVVLPDVVIGRKTVVGAGSVVTKSVEPKVVVVGVPAHKLRDLEV